MTLVFVIGRSQGERHQPLRRLSRQTGSPRSRQLQQDPFPLFKCVQTVPLCHYQIGHTYFTQEMKVFLLLVTSAFLCLVKMTSETWPEESDYHQSVHTLAHHVITCLCGCCPNFVFHEEGGEQGFLCVLACMYLSENVCTAIWPNRHANTPEILQDRSVSRVKMSNTAYRPISLSSCHFSDEEDSPLSDHTHTADSSLCQVKTSGILRKFRVKPASKMNCSLTPSGVYKG